MDNIKMGGFICELRKSKHLTQKELAERLGISDKAVSKWERGLSCPDISLLSSLANILGITTSELLNGEKCEALPTSCAENIDNAFQYANQTAENRNKSIHNICSSIVTVLFTLGILVCSICNFAISGRFTWSLYPIASIVYTWLAVIPIIKWGQRGIVLSLISISAFTVPFLYVLNVLTQSGNLIMPIGIRVCAVSIPVLWLVFYLFKKLRVRKLQAAGFLLLLAVPVNIAINIIISKIISEPIFDVWDIMSISIIIVCSIILFVLDFFHSRARIVR